MKLFENKKRGNIRTVSLLGFPIYVTEQTLKYRIQKILGGLIYTKRLKSNIKERKIFKVLNFPVSKRITENNVIRYYSFGRIVKTIPLIEQFYNEHLKNIKFDYDDVYVLHSNSGEIYLFFAYLADAVLKKNGSLKPLFIATQKYHIDIMKLYFPTAKYIYIEDLKIKTQSDLLECHGHRFFMIFSGNHFEKVELDVKNKEKGTVHYLKSIIKTLGMNDSDCHLPKPIMSLDVNKSVLRKVNNIGLKLNNFVIVAPEAMTCEELSKEFWEQIVCILREKGFDVFLNITNKKNNINNCKIANLTYSEIYSLSQKAKAIISLRSGLSEFVLPTEIPNISIYTRFRRRNEDFAFPVDKGIAGFSMLKMPYVNKANIIELNADDYQTMEELKDVTIKSFENMLNKEESLV